MPTFGRRAAPLGIVAAGLAALASVGHACDYTVEKKASLRFNIETDRLYLEGGGCITPSDIYQAKLSPVSDTDGNTLTAEEAERIPIKPITKGGEPAVNETGYWIFTSDVYIYDGVKLELHAESGTTGMRLKSDSKIIELRAHGGWLSLLNTELSSWDEEEERYASSSNESMPRSYVTAISEVLETPRQTCLGHAKNDAGEARFDIINSEVHHLGYKDTEAYGITWKVRGFCVDLSNEDLFERVNVRGDIRFSDIHDNFFGMYTYGHQDGLWEYNLMHDNTEYGFDPHDDSDNLRIHNNVVYGNGNHGIIASKRCNDVSIQNNVVYDNDNAGIMLHRSSDHAIVRNNTIYGNGDSCIAIFESMEGDYSGNTCTDNKYGIRWSVGAAHNKVYDNEIYDSEQYGIYMYKGSDYPYVVNDTDPYYTGGFPSYNIIANNIIDTAAEGIKIGDTVGNEFTGNVIRNTDTLRFRESPGTIWKDNTIPAGMKIDTIGACFSADSDMDQLGAVTIC